MKQKADIVSTTLSPEELFWTYYWLGKIVELGILGNMIGM